MSKVRCIRTTIKTIDTRTVKPPAKKADAELLTTAHRQWAEAVKRRAGYRCEAIEGGARCGVQAPSRLFADHIIERRDGGEALDPENGRAMCGHHHGLKTMRERARRMAEKP